MPPEGSPSPTDPITIACPVCLGVRELADQERDALLYSGLVLGLMTALAGLDAITRLRESLCAKHLDAITRLRENLPEVH